eukprot:TRINITY_DN778617_c0_g1_i1.p1 TRINITY_DN778617_c0_g1~~TRINITY_DN778617_c0_g1_i1.p1  ORF type:complete len:102 (-),score=21.99 TRINITY_DN778617_c0_g1_i1:163-468(-)
MSIDTRLDEELNQFDKILEFSQKIRDSDKLKELLVPQKDEESLEDEQIKLLRSLERDCIEASTVFASVENWAEIVENLKQRVEETDSKKSILKRISGIKLR